LRQTVLVVAAALAAFGLTTVGSFDFDDYSLFNDPSLTSPSGWYEVWQPMQTRPLTWFTFWMNYQAGGSNPVGFHIVDLLLHVSVAVLLLIVLRPLVPARVALIAALLFAVHPIQTQAVAYVFARGTLLSTLLCLVSLWFWLKGRGWAAVAWFSVALLAKEECAAFPFFLMALEWVGVHTSPATSRSKAWITMLALSLAAGLRVMYVATLIRAAGVGAGSGISPLAYLSEQGVAILRYLAMLVLPWGYTVDPDIAAPLGWRIAAWALLILAVALATIWRGPGFWFLAGLLLLAPSSSLFPASDLVADRRMYLPMITFSVCAALAMKAWRREALAVLFVALTVISIRYSWVWHSERSLWSEAVARAPGKVRPRIQLSRALAPVQALALLNAAQRIAPSDPDVASEQGRRYLELGHPPDALAAFGRALALSPGDASAINNRGVALLALGQAEAAMADFERALKLNPCLFDALLNLQRLGAKGPLGTCRFTPNQAAQLHDR
jgi:hypothetical protein